MDFFEKKNYSCSSIERLYCESTVTIGESVRTEHVNI